MNTKDLYNVEHPYRQLAIAILEELEGRLDAEWKGELWYELEDRLTETIAWYLEEYFPSQHLLKVTHL